MTADTLLVESAKTIRFDHRLREGSEMVATPAGISARWADTWSGHGPGRTDDLAVSWATVLTAARRQIGLRGLLTLVLRRTP